MSKKISYIITDNNITVNYEGQTHIVARSDELATKLIAALREKRQEDIPNLVSAAKRVVNYGQGDFQVKDGEILIKGQPVHHVLSRKILSFQQEGLPHLPLVRFAENLQNNPSYRAVTELFQFLEKNDHPITEEGKFIAYKRVRSDFLDIHSGTIDNSPGTEPSMPRNQVNENSNETCSHGLHVANWDYAHNHFGSSQKESDVMLEVEVDPADVVSIPVDYDQAKMRVCKYKVLGVIDKAHSSDVRLRGHEPDPVLEYNEEEDEVEDEEEDEVDEECLDCGAYVEPGNDLCEDCVEVEFDDDEVDEYPWNDELS